MRDIADSMKIIADAYYEEECYEEEQLQEAYQQGYENAKKEFTEKIMSFINTSNRGNCDYFIVDQIESALAEWQKKTENN